MHRKAFVVLTALMFSAPAALPAAANPAAEREQVLRVCMGCHCLEYYITPRSRKAWELTVSNMRLYAQNGARPFSEADAARVVDYMATYFDTYSNLNAAQHFAKAPEPAPAAAAPVAPAPAPVVTAAVAPAPAPVVAAAVAPEPAPEPVVTAAVAPEPAPEPVVAAAVVPEPEPAVAAPVVPAPEPAVAAPVAPMPEPVVVAAVAVAPEPVAALAVAVAPEPALSVPSARINPAVSAALRERLEHPRWKPSPLLLRVAEAGGYLAVACTLFLLTSGHNRRRLGRRFRPLHIFAALGLFLGLATHAVIYLARYGGPPVLWYWFGVVSFLVLVLAQVQGLVRKRFGRVFLRVHVAAGYCGLTLALLHWIWAWL